MAMAEAPIEMSQCSPTRILHFCVNCENANVEMTAGLGLELCSVGGEGLLLYKGHVLAKVKN